MTKKIDRRVKRTRAMLCHAILDLILEQEYETITVRAITERADLNRATFYLHYSNREELLIAALEMQFDTLAAKVAHKESDLPFWEDTTDIQMLFEHVGDHAPLYQVLLGKNGMGYIIHRMIDYIADYARGNWHQAFAEAHIDPAQIDPIESACYRWISGGIYGLISWWILNDQPYTAEKMAKTAHDFIQYGAKPIFMDILDSSNN